MILVTHLSYTILHDEGFGVALGWKDFMGIAALPALHHVFPTRMHLEWHRSPLGHVVSR